MNETLDLVTLIEQSKKDNEALLKLIQYYEPKLYKSLYQTTENNREDMKQELLVKLIVAIKKYDIDSVPGFWELKSVCSEYKA